MIALALYLLGAALTFFWFERRAAIPIPRGVTLSSSAGWPVFWFFEWTLRIIERARRPRLEGARTNPLLDDPDGKRWAAIQRRLNPFAAARVVNAAAQAGVTRDELEAFLDDKVVAPKAAAALREIVDALHSGGDDTMSIGFDGRTTRELREDSVFPSIHVPTTPEAR